jgi:hypothetical protein
MSTDLCILTNQMQQDLYEDIRTRLESQTVYGWSMESLFAVETNGKLTNEAVVTRFLRYISGSKKEKDYPDPRESSSMLQRIHKLCTMKDSRQPFTQLWFLPHDNINKVSVAVKEIMMKDDVLKHYAIMCVNSKVKLCSKLKEAVEIEYNRAKNANKRGLIILAHGMLSLGVSIPHCDVVFMLHGISSSDMVYQQMMRCMTEDSGKKIGIVVDMNIGRILNTCLTYNLHDKNKTTDKKFEYIIKNNIFEIDSDYFCTKERDAKMLIGRLLKYWRADQVNSIKTRLQSLKNHPLMLLGDDLKLAKTLFGETTGSSTVRAKCIIKGSQDLPSGIEREKNKNESCSEDDSSSDESDTEEENEFCFEREIFPRVTILICFLAMLSRECDFLGLLQIVKDNPKLLKIFDEQAYVWWKKTEIINFVEKIVKKYVKSDNPINNISLEIKMDLKALIDKPDELIEFMDECLHPKDNEKKQFGEVFTPMKWVNIMLDVLPSSVWINPNLKWLDPASGMGNFPIAIYQRLMSGLKKVIPDKIKRKKHILEKMLYMCELNSKNSFLCKQIFDIGNKYRLNLLCKDSLTTDFTELNWPAKFDIVVGNPPYNQELTRTGALPLYNKFIERYIDMC